MNLELEIEPFTAGGQREFEAPRARAFAPSKALLKLDGKPAGFVHSASGGDAVAEVVQVGIGSSFVTKKHIGSLKYEPIELEVSLPLEAPLFDWIANSWANKAGSKSGEIQWLDLNNRQQSVLEFHNALITETAFPALDAASKDIGKIRIKVSPERTRYKKGSGAGVPGAQASKQKAWLPANFRLTINGLDAKSVSRIEPLVIKQKVNMFEVGQERIATLEPTRLEFPNLEITLNEKNADQWRAWHEDFVIRGDNGEGKEKSGSLDLLAPDMKSVLATIEFANLGIMKFAREKQGADSIARVRAEMYCEEMRLRSPKSAPAPKK